MAPEGTPPPTWAAAALRWAVLTSSWAAVVPPAAPAVLSDVFYKVANPTFPRLTECTLTTHRLTDRLTCAAACQRTSECSMYCLSGAECRLYRARVGRAWAGASGEALRPGVCYSCWGGRLTPLASVAAASEAFSATYAAPKALSGFHCGALTECYCSAASREGFLALSLGGAARSVSSVKIQTWSAFFEGVEVRVGNSSSSSSSALLGAFPGSVASRRVVALEASQPLVGSVVSIRQATTQDKNLCICDVQIFGR